MLSTSGLPKSFWVEATVTAIHLINKNSLYAINFKTPQEMWSKKPARYDHLRVFVVWLMHT